MTSKKITEIIRVNHAGEYGAKRIYQGQLDFIKDPEAKKKIQEMHDQEIEHLEYFSAALDKRNVSPTKLQPLWHVAGYALGAASAILGEKAAMATTIAVEEVIIDHYQEQLDSLGDDEKDLKENIQKFKDDEDEHRETGVEHHGLEALFYKQGAKFIKNGSKLAIWLSKRF